MMKPIESLKWRLKIAIFQTIQTIFLGIGVCISGWYLECTPTKNDHQEDHVAGIHLTFTFQLMEKEASEGPGFSLMGRFFCSPVQSRFPKKDPQHLKG